MTVGELIEELREFPWYYEVHVHEYSSPTFVPATITHGDYLGEDPVVIIE